MQKGAVLRVEGHPEEGVAEQERALALDPSNVNAAADLGFDYANRGEFDKSLEYLDKAILASPHDPSLKYWCGAEAEADFALRRYDQAIESARRAIAINPDYNAFAHAMLERRSPCRIMMRKRARRCGATSRCPPPGRSGRSRNGGTISSPNGTSIHASSTATNGPSQACAKPGCRRNERSRFGRKRSRCKAGSSASVKPISRSHWNDGYGADSGSSRGDSRRRAFRPISTSPRATGYVRFTSTPVILRRENSSRRAGDLSYDWHSQERFPERPFVFRKIPGRMLLLRRPHFPRDNCQRRRRAAGRGLDLIRIGSRSRAGLSWRHREHRGFRWSTSPSLLQEPVRTPQTAFAGPPRGSEASGAARCEPSGAGSAIRLSRHASTLCRTPANGKEL